MIGLIDRRARLGSLPAVSVTGADSAAGAEPGSITVPSGERWVLKAVSVTMVQGLTQTPWPRLKIVDADSNILFQAQAGTAAGAVSTTEQVTWASGLVTTGPLGATTAVSRTGGLPEDLVLEAGAVISVVTVGIGGNTDYGKLVASVIKLPA